MSDYTDVRTPRGRLVSGDCFKPRTKDFQNNPLTYKNGPQAGQPRQEFSVGIAITKAEAAPLIQALEAKAAEGFPALFTGGQKPAHFSYKYVDGDSQTPNQSGRVPAQQEGYAGCYVFFFTSNEAPACYNWGEWTTELMGTGIKRGDYIMLTGSLKNNGDTMKPGMYLNLDRVALMEAGPAIMGTKQSAADAFMGGGAPAPAMPGVPAGVPAQPAPAAALPPVPATQLPAAPGVPAPAAQPAPAAPVAPPAVTTPHTGILDPAGVPAAPAPAAPAPVKRMHNGVAYEESALAASGWTPDMIAGLPQV